MSEAKEYTFDVVKKDATCTIEVSGAFFGRLQRLYFAYLAQFETAEIAKENIVKALTQSEFSNDEGKLFDLQTIFMLMMSIDKAFQEQGKTTGEKVTIDPENPPDAFVNAG